MQREVSVKVCGGSTGLGVGQIYLHPISLPKSLGTSPKPIRHLTTSQSLGDISKYCQLLTTHPKA